MSSINDFSGYTPTWCPGCGNWAIGVAIKTALVKLDLSPSTVFLVFGIGCSGNMNDFLNGNAIHALHGRAIPNAIGMKLVNHKIPVIVVVGDGDCYGEGGNHFLHACRGNHDMTVLVHDNRVYGLTTGQVAPTASKGFKSKSTPSGIIETPVNPLTLALTQGATFVAQAYAADVVHLSEIIRLAIKHQGFSLVNILQPCVTFNKLNTYQYYQEKVYKLEDDYKADDKNLALLKARELSEEKFPIGILYQKKELSYHQQLEQLKDDQPLVSKKKFSDFGLLIKDFI